jgi:hypothetical protein
MHDSMPEAFLQTLRFTLLLESAVKEEVLLCVAQCYRQILATKVSRHIEVLLQSLNCVDAVSR